MPHLATIFLMCSCLKIPFKTADTKATKILGLWQPITMEERGDGSRILALEFFEDGTFAARSLTYLLGVEMADGINGKWLILHDGRLKMDSSAFGIQNMYVTTLDFEGNAMIFDGQRFERPNK
jgi:hypothetical protein